MSLALLVGPANAGKVARLLDRYLDVLERNPVLVVPNRADVERAERDLVRRAPAITGGSIGTFDDLFERVVRAGNGAGAGARLAIGRAQRSLLLARVVARASLNGLSDSARFQGFTDALADAIAELESALIEPAALGGHLGNLYGAYRQELDALGLRDRDLVRAHAADLVARDLGAWDGSPVFAYGFEDLTGAEWELLEALAGRADVTVSLPYEPGRRAFTSLTRTANDLARLADGRVEELPARGAYEAPALAYLERVLFEERGAGDPGAPVAPPPDLEGAVRFLEAAGTRAALELVAEEILALVRSGVPAEEIAIVCPKLEPWRAAFETVFAALGVPYALEGQIPLARTPFGQALLGLLRFAWLGSGRKDLFSFLRSPYSTLPRGRVDFVEGRLRGRAVSDGARVEEEAKRLLGHGLRALDELRSSGSAIGAVRSVASAMVQAAHGLDAPPRSEGSRIDLRAHEALRKLLDELEGWLALGGEVSREDLVRSLERAPLPLPQPRQPGRVAVVDLLRARTRRFAAVFLLGLEEGVFPRRVTESPFLRDDERRELEEARPGRRVVRADQLARDRYLFYAACTRAWRRLTLVREAATDDGRPREPSAFYEEVRARFARDDVARWTRRRSLSDVGWELERAPTERERLRATAVIAAGDEAEARALARANGWERRIERGLAAFSRPTELRHPQVLR
ncbi:MAG: hypothetical protein M3312_09045, partial [Actinomycetota bacterium]|nr:hypothetical protein [Actinomycetota bacterium]